VPRRRDATTAALVAVLGLLACVVLFAELRITGSFDQDAALIRLPHAIRRELLAAHLGLEKGLAGDEAVDLEGAVFGPFREARALTRAGIEGGEVLGTVLRPVQDAEARELLSRIDADALLLETRARERIGRGAPAAAGPAADAEFDRRFLEAEGRCIELGGMTAGLARANRVLLRRINHGLLALLGTAGLLLFLRARRAAERDRGRREELEREVAERTAGLARSEDRLRSILQAVPDPVLILDAGGTVESANPAAQAALGWPPGEIEGSGIDGHLAEDSRGAAGALLRAAAGPGGAAPGLRDLRVRRRDGSGFPAEAAAGGIAGGDRPRVVLVLRDVSDRRAAEEERDRFFALSPDLLCIAGADGTFRRVNDAFARALGRDREDLPARPLLEFVHPDDREDAIEDLAALAGPRAATRDFEVRFLRRDGSAIWLSWKATSVPERGVIYAVARDVTESRATTDALRRAKESAEDAARIKSTFLATMSHEIRTPMNAIIGMSGLLLDSPLTRLQREYAETIRTGGESLLSVVDDILDFSKIESGKVELEEAPFEASVCIEEALSLAAPRAAEKGIELLGFPDPSVPPLLSGDGTRLRQVLVNLVGNAVKFTAAGEVEVRAEARPLPDGTWEAHFSVRDTGPGIPPERRDRLFRPFSQVDASTTRRYGGTGLGLAISRGLCERMGGGMWVEGGPGRGSTFHFTIRARPATAAPAPERPYAGRRALVAAGAIAARRTLAARLARWGFAVSEADSAEAASAALGAAPPPDVAVIDRALVPPEGVAAIRADAGSRGAVRVPLVLLAPLGAAPPAEFAALQPAEWVVKPVRLSALHDAVATLLGGPPREAAPATSAGDDALAARFPLRVLVAEDNPVNREVTSRMLERFGYRAEFVEDGSAAAERALAGEADLVLMDLHMPGTDGLEGTRRIRAARPRSRGPRIVALTASALVQDRRACEAAGMDDFLAKPLRLDDLRRVLEATAALLAGRPAEAAPAGGAAPPPPDGDLLDPKALDSIRSVGDAALVRQVIGLWLRDAPERAARLRAAAAAGDAKGTAAEAHALRGASLNTGAAAVARVAEGIEADARRGATPGPARLDALDAAVRASAEALRGFS
jgi:PAS domain S-box-containing protein